MKYKIEIAYDGSSYYGFQRLNNLPTIQKEIETALTKINKEKVEIKGSGRTDRKVHAYGQIAHFKLTTNIPPNRLKTALNNLLPSSIKIISCSYVKNDFHARHSVIEKTYIYKIYTKENNPFIYNYAYIYNQPLNIKKMKKAAKKLEGAHNYENFVSGTRKNYNSIITKITLKKEKDYLIFEFTGKSFYRYMVRNLVGALLEIGKEKIEIKKIDELINKKCPKILFTAPPQGLYLKKIKY